MLVVLLTAYSLLKRWARRRAVAVTQALWVLLVVFLVVAQRRQEVLPLSSVGINFFSYSHFARETAALTIPVRIQRLEEFYTTPVLYAALAAMLWTAVRSLRRSGADDRKLHLATLATGIMILGLVLGLA